MRNYKLPASPAGGQILNSKLIGGISLVEILIVVSVFAVLGILATRTVLLTLRGTQKSESLVRVRENLNYSLAIIERQLRNSESVSCLSSTKVSLTDLNGTATYFECLAGYIASGSARLTSGDIKITSCSFTCSAGSDGLPSVAVSASAQDSAATGVESAQVTSETTIFLRTY